METRALRYFHKPPKDYKTTVIAQTTDISTALAGKVDKSSGRGLTQNSYTTPEKDKLEGIEPKAEVNVLADWNEQDTESDAYILNKPESLPASDVYEWAKQPTKPVYTPTEIGLGNVTNDVQVKRSEMGVANGVATLNQDGLVPATQLPSYVDDVLEYSSVSLFPIPGTDGKIYVDTTTNLTYRWSGSDYVEISKSLALGETSSTAYRGDRGATAYTHATDSSRLTTATSVGLYKVGCTAQGHISDLTAITKDDITGLGIPAQDTNTTYSFAGGTNKFTVTPSEGTAQDITVTPSISAATQSAAGLMSATDKKKLDEIDAGAQVNSVTGVKGNSESSYRTGNVNITATNIGLSNVANLDLSKAIKSITRSGTTFTYTCLDGTTGTFTLQDNNTTYNFSGTSFTSNNSTGLNANDVTYNSHTYYTSNGPTTTLGASTSDGALYAQAYSTSWVALIAQDYRNGNLFTRGKNNGTWKTWRKVFYSDDTYAGTLTKSQVTTALGYTPLSLAGGDMTGNIKWKGASQEILSFAPTDSSWRGGLKYSWASNTTIALWGKHTNTQFVWHAGTDFSSNDVNGTTTRTYDFQVGRSNGTLLALVGGLAVVLNDDSRLTDSRPASDVYSWAKASSKPTYTASEVGALSSTTKYAASASVGGAASSLNGGIVLTEQSENNCIPSAGCAGFFKVTTSTTGGSDGFMTAYRWPSGNWLTQLFFDVDPTYTAALRFRNSANEWTSWKKFAFTSDIPTKVSQLTNDSGYITSFTDTKVTQTNADGDDSWHAVLASGSTNTDVAPTATEGAVKSNSFKVNPKNGKVICGLPIYYKSTSQLIINYNNSKQLFFGGMLGGTGDTGIIGNKILFLAGAGSTIHARFNTSGYFGVGIDPSYKIHCNAAIGATGFTNTSDIRDKDIIEDAEITTEQIAEAPQFKFTWKKDGLGDIDDDGVHIGTSAQYWQEIIPEVVSVASDEKGTLSMQYGVVALLSATQLAKEILALKEEISSLKDRIAELENK